MTWATSVNRQQQLTQWASTILSIDPQAMTIIPLAVDAGHRKYYRISWLKKTVVAVDALAEKIIECRRFTAIAKFWSQMDIPVPKIIAVSYSQGFIIQEDCGTTLLSVLKPNNVHHYYQQALDQLLNIQLIPSTYLNKYNEVAMFSELMIYFEWFLGYFLNVKVQFSFISTMFLQLIDALIKQPTTTVHKDYHSRNLMINDNQLLSIIDFQDAAEGPIMYDAVSLLKDCYVAWPDYQISQWLELFVSKHPELSCYSSSKLIHWFDLTGLQRHLKCLGIFSRLWLRDKKYQYLAEMPRVLSYILPICSKYPFLKTHGIWLAETVQPQLKTYLHQLLEERVS